MLLPARSWRPAPFSAATRPDPRKVPFRGIHDFRTNWPRRDSPSRRFRMAGRRRHRAPRPRGLSHEDRLPVLWRARREEDGRRTTCGVEAAEMSTTIAFIGFGEVGQLFARELAGKPGVDIAVHDILFDD